MGCPMQGIKTQLNEDRKPYESYQVDCWLQNKEPVSEDVWKKLMIKLRKRAESKLTKISKHDRKYKCYAHHFNH